MGGGARLTTLHVGAATTTTTTTPHHSPSLLFVHAQRRGTNDGGNNITANMIIVLNNLMAACPGTPIIVLRPFNGNAQAANLQASCAGSATPALCHYISTDGFYNTSYGGALHPTGPNDTGRVAPAIANAVRGILAAGTVAREALTPEEEALVLAHRRLRAL